MTVRYIIKSPRHLLQYLAGNLLPKGSLFYSTFRIPEDADMHALDVKLLLRYRSYLSKEQRHRRTKGGLASVRYLRCGNVGFFIATKGESPFFSEEPWRDVRAQPLHVAGHTLTVNGAGKAVVGIHREARRKLRLHLLENVRLPLRQLEHLIWNVEFVPFAGVQRAVSAEVKNLNEMRRKLGLIEVDPANCVRRRFKVETRFEETPEEVAEVVRWYLREQKRVR